MTETTFRTIAIVLYFAGMLAIGLFAYRKTKNSLDEYMLAGRGLRPSVAALSAGASDMSGWLLMGLPGAIYLSGLVEAWIAVGLTIGAWVNWKFVAPRLRAFTEKAGDSITIPSFFEQRLKDNTRLLRIVCGVIILVFFTFYVSSGMVAAGKFFESSFGLNYMAGMLIVAAITMIYTLFGGFLGATLTDVAQGLLMFAALIAVPVVAVFNAGGPATVISNVKEIDPSLLSLFGSGPFWAGGTYLAVISALAWGLGYFGQPHIIVRFMALRTPADAKVARRIGVSWMGISALGAIATAIVGISYFSDHADMKPTDPETVFLDLTQILFHPFIAGLVLAAVLAAIMSTISSQLVVTSSALIEDLYKIVSLRTGSKHTLQDKTYVLLGRLGILVVAIIAVLLAISPSNSILDLVAFAWAGFGASFGPIVLLTLFWKRLSNWGALFGLISGAAVAFIWGQVSTPLTDSIYEIIPGFAVNLIVAVVVSKFTYQHNADMDADFDESVELSRVK
ncbi:MAG: sodium/proline symporter PutP [Brevibacterium sp.]|uniref:sodium/proline symporter PutP n=1 Tax=Brevibacterium sp. TaxID=1701 RepID=UPI0026495EBA|nr:sodium/proline symporter PutP [Brevibacterium sp.]MDN5807696.1 sodium/proline symporter PutP [Brevibacterium sp.]MDN5832723.1 sodium/proline symporter PutP [Brevibacterium sp.]MDN5876244.1 sodium/proline symporter PutP [Brevibacterium sp.]MDN5909871.1 sodium/proline symporter PutP [Brevibacterium sp.]MDN6123640.1 sodium/proline symporter PutP [Brevibacterium sp.]